MNRNLSLNVSFHKGLSSVDEGKGSFNGALVTEEDLETLGTTMERTEVVNMIKVPKLMKDLDSRILKVAKHTGVSTDAAWACFWNLIRDRHENNEKSVFNWHSYTRAEKDAIIDLTTEKLSSYYEVTNVGACRYDLVSEVSRQNRITTNEYPKNGIPKLERRLK
jgi:hypothetical protein